MHVMKEFFFASLWKSFRPAFEELIVRLAITSVTLLSLAGVELLLEVLHLANKVIPRMHVTLSIGCFT